MSIFTKGINKAAYSGRLTCPVCDSEANRFMEWVTSTRARYRCRRCGLTYQYDISGAPYPHNHPYEPFKQQRFKYMVDMYWERQKRRNQ